MKRKEFIKEFKNTSVNYNTDHEIRVIKNSIECNLKDGNPRGHRNLIIVMEELAEMSQAVSKQLRDKGDYYNTIEEMADISLCIDYLKDILNISQDEIQRAKQVKLHRLEKTLMKKGYFK